MTAMKVGNPTGPATAPQRSLLRALIREREITTIIIPKAMTEEQASDLIDVAMEAPRIRKPPVAPGFYLFEGEVVKVVLNLAGTGSYAQSLEVEGRAFKSGRWRYTPGLISDLTPDHKLTLKVAVIFGHTYDICAICAKRLTTTAGIHANCKIKLKESRS
jgi:hypothetical protein